MVWIPGGEFLMGSDHHYPEERPTHRVSVDGFWMGAHPITAAEFRRFTRVTNYVTVAERPLDPASYPGATGDPQLQVSTVSGDCRSTGHVWEWTTDWYATASHIHKGQPACCAPSDPRVTDPSHSFADPAQPGAEIPRKVIKGGSHLCAPNSCLRYRPAARQPQMIDTSMSHLGFRCIARPSRHTKNLMAPPWKS